jgi:hypothetical protein
MEKSPLADKIYDALHLHREWRMRIKYAISSGRFEMIPEQIIGDTCCELGRWLHYGVTEPEKSVEYHALKAAHLRFHHVVSEIVRRGLEGRTLEASDEIRPGSEFMELSAAMNRELTKWLAKV